ncbi:hypothetical protein PMAC_002300 [Pneumocystis sp. 'macacae']|nr:hypothetical protein PMAC_002300 [Pneumocystis sp. 'macacae']
MDLNSLLNIIKASIYLFSEESSKKKTSSLKDSYDAIACLINAYMLSLGFKLLGFGENHNLDTPITSSEIKPFFESQSESKNSFHAFKYSFYDSNDAFLIKFLKMDKKIVILGTKMGNEDIVSCDLLIDHYTQKDCLPYPDTEKGSSLENIYISNAKIIELVETYKTNILHKLVSDLKSSYFEKINPYEKMSFQAFKHNTPSRLFENSISSKFDKQTKQQIGQKIDIPVAHSSSFSIGSSDLYPPGIEPHPSMSPYIEDNSSDRIYGCINGMYLHKNNPMFTRFGKYTPHGMVPPGVRYDPVTPYDIYSIEPGNLSNPSKSRNTGEPDNDEFLPPGVDNMVQQIQKKTLEPVY